MGSTWSYRSRRVRLVRKSCRYARRNQVEESPQRAEDEFYLQPGDFVELFHHVEQVEKQQETGEPDAGPSNEIVERSSGVERMSAHFNTNEPKEC